MGESASPTNDVAEDQVDPEARRREIRESVRSATIDGLVGKINGARAAAGMSKAELARAIGADPAAVRRLFSLHSANPTLGTLAELAAALGMRVTLEPLPKKERKQVTKPLLEGRGADARALAKHVSSI